jgi:putative restriction endonuclease
MWYWARQTIWEMTVRPFSAGGVQCGELPCCRHGTANVHSADMTAQLAGASAGIDAAHVRWFNFDGPDDLDNGLALCALHHKLFDLGALGLDLSLRVLVSAVFNARTSAGRAVYELHGRLLTPRPGTITPSADHITWHAREVFKGKPLAA